MASLISPDVKVTDLGKPDKRCKPLTSEKFINSSSGNADPILILISSAVLLQRLSCELF